MKGLTASLLIATPLAVVTKAQASCLTSANAWQNASVRAQIESFSVQFDVTPSMAKMDGVVGLSNGPASAFTSFATAIRFNNTGTIDARNGGAYAAAAAIPYSPGLTYHIRMAINVTNRTYSAYVTPPGSSEHLIGSNYAFRTEQATASTMNNLGMLADSATETVCNWSVGSATTSGSGDATNAAWQNTPIIPQNAMFEAKFDATPSAANMDGVIGFSNGPASALSNLTMAVRFKRITQKRIVRR